VIEKSPVGACVPMAWGESQRAMETGQHRDRLAKNQPAEIAMFQISEVQESPAFNGRLTFLTLRVSIENKNIPVVMFLGFSDHLFCSVLA
jgi:hypothetical protein